MPAERKISSFVVVASFAAALSAYGQGASTVSATGAAAALKKDGPAAAAAKPKPVAPAAPKATVQSTPPRTPSVAVPSFNSSAMPHLGYARYPWKVDIVATVFWIGEEPTENNPTPNDKSSWDTQWTQNYGGYDDPDPAKRTENFTPVGFTPKQNPFYVALPYNDVIDFDSHKPEASRVIPWFKQRFVRSGKTVLKGQWIAIRYGNRVCYAQWEDCGPFVTDDHEYVFGNSRPKNTSNRGAGIDISPAVRDYLGMSSSGRCDWRFVDVSEVPAGPWRSLGSNNHFVTQQKAEKAREHSEISSRLEELRRMRDAYFQQNGSGAVR
ncbi:hypothetical protein [Prosthecobacter vanneervenii]|uniref:Uncharacterized protein n=1 Tax=Prosthecobacter vanneervenii TaxID=48466 RepID=A0A7W7YDB6_9BACT|nr:hypothetical protein [Prosthecobacter vanneervenii]MBB5034093.1 hypothetical protein [Prosthecobacter vanneervenii]